jgi:serine/threonine protein kinase
MKIGDFGYSKIFNIEVNGLSTVDKILSQDVGTTLNNPAESIKLDSVMDAKEFYDANSDIWSLGIILFKMFS